LRAPPSSSGLQAVGLRKTYGSVVANRNVSIATQAGSIHAVVGENGAGKSTLMRLLQGVERPDGGEIFVDGVRVDFTNPGDALRHGIGMVHQEFMIAPDLSLLENLVLGEEPVKRSCGPLSWIDWPAARNQGQALAEQIGALIDWDQHAANAPVHILQFVEIIRLLRRGCRTLILDEPTAVLAPVQVDELFTLLRNLRTQGTALLFISHKIGEVTALADEVTVIRQGETVFHSSVAECTADEISRHIVNGELHDVVNDEAPKPQSELLSIASLNTRSVNRSHTLHNISLTIGRGEILGIAGVSGNGQNELAECLVGLRPSSGLVKLNGIALSALNPSQRRRHGIAYISADRRHEGLSIQSSIETNVVAGSHRTSPIGHGVWLNRAAMRKIAQDRLQALDIKYDGPSDPVSSLSGGNQQKLVFAREIATAPQVLIASQPTRGVDLNGIAAIHQLIRDFRDSGGAVLLISEELDELIELSTRVAVIAEGTIVGTVNAPASNLPLIGRMMVQGAAV